MTNAQRDDNIFGRRILTFQDSSKDDPYSSEISNLQQTPLFSFGIFGSSFCQNEFGNGFDKSQKIYRKILQIDDAEIQMKNAAKPDSSHEHVDNY